MKSSSVFMLSIIISYSAPALCMKKKQSSRSRTQEIQLKGLHNTNIVMQLLKKSDYFLINYVRLYLVIQF